MEKLRHAWPIVHGVVVPEEWLAPELFADALQVPGRILARADLLARPEHFNGRVQRPADILQIVPRALAEDTIEQRIVGIVARANDQSRRSRMRLHKMGD